MSNTQSLDNCPNVYPQLIQFQSYRGKGRLYFEENHGLWNGCIAELLYQTFSSFLTAGWAFCYPISGKD